MVRRRGSASVVLILLVLAAVAAAVLAVVLPPQLRPGGSAPRAAEPVEAVAVVVESAPCSLDTGGDLVEITVRGEPQRVRFDGCGHPVGTELPVWVSSTGGETTARPVGAAAPSSGEDDLRTRVSWVLLTLACAAGAGYAGLFRPAR